MTWRAVFTKSPASDFSFSLTYTSAHTVEGRSAETYRSRVVCLSDVSKRGGTLLGCEAACRARMPRLNTTVSRRPTLDTYYLDHLAYPNIGDLDATLSLHSPSLNLHPQHLPLYSPTATRPVIVRLTLKASFTELYPPSQLNSYPFTPFSPDTITFDSQCCRVVPRVSDDHLDGKSSQDSVGAVDQFFRLRPSSHLFQVPRTRVPAQRPPVVIDAAALVLPVVSGIGVWGFVSDRDKGRMSCSRLSRV